MHDLGPLALQLLDDLHARDQPLLAILEILDVGDLRIELDDLLLQEVVLLVLRIDPAGVDDFRAEGKDRAGEKRRDRGDAELAAPDSYVLVRAGEIG